MSRRAHSWLTKNCFLHPEPKEAVKFYAGISRHRHAAPIWRNFLSQGTWHLHLHMQANTFLLCAQLSALRSRTQHIKCGNREACIQVPSQSLPGFVSKGKPPGYPEPALGCQVGKGLALPGCCSGGDGLGVQTSDCWEASPSVYIK